MNFDQLNYFTEVYRQKSISQAADNLYVSRPALSTAIRKLEKDLGDITLFTRMPNGVLPTPAGDELYQSAQIILEEYAKMIFNMKKYSALTDANNIIKIGLSSGLSDSYGEEIAERLLLTYPHIYFDFAEVVPYEQPEFYKDFDLTIILTTEFSHKTRYQPLEASFSVTHVGVLPMYIWLSDSSPLQKYSVIPIDMLKSYPFCSLKNAYNGTNYASYLKSFYNITNSKPNMELKKSFIQHIEQFGYYTIDHARGDGNSFHYETIFKDKAVSLKKTDFDFLLLIICKKDNYEKYKHLYPLITNILTGNSNI